MTNFKNLRAWCLTDGSAGMISQVKGLADALNLNFEQKTIDLKFPWNKLPVGILPPSKIIFNNYRQISLESNIPPDIIISCGKRSIYASLHLKKSLKIAKNGKKSDVTKTHAFQHHLFSICLRFGLRKRLQNLGFFALFSKTSIL